MNTYKDLKRNKRMVERQDRMQQLDRYLAQLRQAAPKREKVAA